MAEDPVIDGRDERKLLEEATAIAPYYTLEWDPTSGDVGSAVLKIFAEIAEDVVERLDRVPQKHFVSFLDTLGFSRGAPQAARLPLTFLVADGVEGNVAISEGTRAVAEATESRPEQTFEVAPGGGFEATPSRIEQVYSVHPDTDGVFEHWSALESGEGSTVFRGENLQEHIFYIGHADAFTLKPGAAIEVILRSPAPERILENRDSLVWEYYGVQAPDDGTDGSEGTGGNAEVGWHRAEETWPAETTDGAVELELVIGGEPGELKLPVPAPREEAAATAATATEAEPGTETGIDDPGTERKWIRCRVDTSAGGERSNDPFDIEMTSVRIRMGTTIGRDADVESGGGPEPGTEGRPGGGTEPGGAPGPGREGRLGGIQPDVLLHNDVPLPTGSDQGDFYPLGKAPRPLDAFYLTAEEAFTKKGATVELTFTEPPLVFEDQIVSLDGSDEKRVTVTIETVTLPEDGSVAIYDANDPSTSIGGREDLAPGTHENVTITFSAPTGFAENRSRTLIAKVEGSEIADEASVTINNKLTGEGDRYRTAPRLSWEYWNGTAWARVIGIQDGTEGFRKAGPVRFVVPDDLASSSVSGHEGYWIRTRLVSGEYTRTTYVLKDPDEEVWQRVPEGAGPRFGVVVVRYGQEDASTTGTGSVVGDPGGSSPTGEGGQGGTTSTDGDPPATTDEQATDDDRADPPLVTFEARPDRLIAYNNLSYTDHSLSDDVERFSPFNRLREEAQTLYVGFDGGLDDGPINLFFLMQDTEYPEGFFPRIGWEHCTAPERDEWSTLSVRDGSESLKQRGIVSLVFPEETTASMRFGREYHWLRARVTGDQFDVGAETHAGVPAQTPPVLRGMYLNTGWAYNVTTVDDEILGSSDGSKTQEFVLSAPPATSEEVWVDELSSLSEETRRTLKQTESIEVEETTNVEGSPERFWVKWNWVADFLGSEDQDRHYVFDPVPGRLSFGDGIRGKIPPRGQDNVRASYERGGGVNGNVAAGDVTGLASSVPFVEAVANPEPGDGGAGEESIDDVLRRAPRQLKNRGRAVSADDFERIAMAASRQLARVKCIAGMNDAGDDEPGWVTLLIVPRTQAKKPTPSTELRHRVRERVGERMPATLADPERERLVVRGPDFLEVSVDAVLKASDVRSIAALEETVTGTIARFLHPLSGGPSEEGWGFGELPHRSDLYALMEGIEGVDHVDELTVSIRTSTEETITMREGTAVPSVPSDSLVFSGTHEIRAEGEL